MKVRPAGHRARAAGFTIMEMMIVVAIVGVTAALAAPAMHGAIMERKNNEAALDLVRLVRRARSESIAYGRAHLLRFDASDRAAFRLYRGVSSSCNAELNDWSEIIAEGACLEAGSFCLDELDLNDGRWELGSSTIQANRPAGGSMDLCYEPRGTLRWRTELDDDVLLVDRNTVQGGFVFAFTREDGGTETGVARRVFLPLGGDARLLQ